MEGDALNLPFSDGSVDAITMGYGLRNVLDKRKALEEMLRVLKEGLLLVILHYFFSFFCGGGRRVLSDLGL